MLRRLLAALPVVNWITTEVERHTLLDLSVHRKPLARGPFGQVAVTGLGPGEFEAQFEDVFVVRAVNHTPNRTLEIKDVWFDCDARPVPVRNPLRPLPHPLGPGGMWETWIAAAEIPAAYRHTAFNLGRARLSTGQTFQSRRTKKDLHPGIGTVAGG